MSEYCVNCEATAKERDSLKAQLENEKLKFETLQDSFAKLDCEFHIDHAEMQSRLAESCKRVTALVAELEELNKFQKTIRSELASQRDAFKAQLEKERKPLFSRRLNCTGANDDIHGACQCFVDHHRKVLEREAELRAELEKYKINADKAICSYCGHIGPKKSYAILHHLLKCKKHPWTKALDGKVLAEKDRDAWRQMAEKLAEALREVHSDCLTCEKGRLPCTAKEALSAFAALSTTAAVTEGQPIEKGRTFTHRDGMAELDKFREGQPEKPS